MSYVLFWPLALGTVMSLLILADVVLMRLVRLANSFTESVEYFSGHESLGQFWLCSLIAQYTIGFTRTRVTILRSVLQLVDVVSYVGIFSVFMWKMGFVAF
jgi:hypothetical protein